jgi:diguanylate cyclase (GGDEF)-like protein/PAS domain S-box-containing protein
MRRIWYFAMLMACTLVQAAEPPFTIGIYAHRPATLLQGRYEPLESYLAQSLPGWVVDIRVLDLDGLERELDQNRLDLIITNPRHYLLLRSRNSLSGVVATLQRSAPDGRVAKSLGGVIFTRADRSDINTLADLRGRSIAAPSSRHLGGFLAQAYELVSRGHDAPQPSQLLVAGKHDHVIDRVLAGDAEVGFVRTGIIEDLTARGYLAESDLKIINRQPLGEFPFISSTRLYPEWPVVALPHVDDQTLSRLIAALHSLEPDDRVSVIAGIAGVVPPADYSLVGEALRALRMPPFDHEPSITLREIWQQHNLPIVGAVVALALVSALAALLLQRNRLLRHQTDALSKTMRFNETLFQSIPTPLFYKDVDGRYLGVNKGFEDFFGAESSDLVGKTVYDISPPELAEIYAGQDRDLLQQGGQQHYETQVRRPSGELRDVVFDKAVFTDEKNQVQGLIGAVTDVTERRQQERLLEIRAKRDEALFELPIAAEEMSEADFMQRGQEIAEDLTGSLIAFIHFVNSDQQTIELVTWSRRTLSDYCDAVFERHYPVSDAGIWADALRGRTPVVFNDYASYGAKHGLPEGHAALHRLISVPVIEDGKVVMLTGVGNKDEDYDATDIETVQSVSNEIWRLVQRRRNLERLRLAGSVYDHANEGIMVTDIDGTIVDVNDAFCRISGYAREQLVGENPRIMKSGRQGMAFYAEMWRSLQQLGEWRGEIWNRRADGEITALLLNINTVHDAGNKARQYVALFTDINAQKEYQRQLEFIAHYDTLTNLPNRVLLSDRIQQALSQSRRRDQLLAVAYLDLDGFKEINDEHGHQVGDQLLTTVASRMRTVVREGDTIARLGGDEFVIVLLDLNDKEEVLGELSRLLEAVARPVIIGGDKMEVSASIGVTFFPQAREVDADQLLRQADQAMYRAKLLGRNRYCLFDETDGGRQLGEDVLLQRIEQGLRADEFEFFLQPKVNMRSGEVVGAEALIRWQHPERGLLAPPHFLPFIADKPLMIEVGRQAILAALAQLSEWRDKGLSLHLSVNIDAFHLQQPDFVAWLARELKRHPDLEPESLILEVLETSALEDLERVSRVIRECRDIGVLFSLDDFGTGYSSLTYLKNLPAAELKIDQSFVRDCLDDPEDLAILDGVLGLATAFQRRVVAEGVETSLHGEMLLSLGCELAQGYAIARPMPRSEFDDWLKGWHTKTLWEDIEPLGRDDLPLLFATVEHRAWVNRVERCLKGECDEPSLSAQQCRFGAWLQGVGAERYGKMPVFAEIGERHQELHALAEHLIALKGQGEVPYALERLKELHLLRDKVLVSLKDLERAVSSG